MRVLLILGAAWMVRSCCCVGRYDGALEPWLREMWAKLASMYPWSARSADGKLTELPPPLYDTVILSRQHPEASSLSVQLPSCGVGAARSKPYLARMLRNVRLTSESNEQDVRHVEFDLGESRLT